MFRDCASAAANWRDLIRFLWGLNHDRAFISSRLVPHRRLQCMSWDLGTEIYLHFHLTSAKTTGPEIVKSITMVDPWSEEAIILSSLCVIFPCTFKSETSHNSRLACKAWALILIWWGSPSLFLKSMSYLDFQVHHIKIKIFGTKACGWFILRMFRMISAKEPQFWIMRSIQINHECRNLATKQKKWWLKIHQCALRHRIWGAVEVSSNYLNASNYNRGVSLNLQSRVCNCQHRFVCFLSLNISFLLPTCFNRG